MYIKIIKLNTVDSTNDYASRIALLGAREVTVICANHQDRGKGRLGRTWLSVPGKGLYVSFILRPHNSMKDIYYLPLISALAVVKLLEGALDLHKVGKNKKTSDKTLCKIKIKLPNDVIVNGKKIAGILVEAKTTGQSPSFVVVGIGVNINSLKKELPPNSTSLLIETKKEYDIKKLFTKLVKEMITVYVDFKNRKIKNLLTKVFPYQNEKPLEELGEMFSKKQRSEEVIHLI